MTPRYAHSRRERVRRANRWHMYRHHINVLPARLEEREREVAAQAETPGEQIAQLTARLDELGRAGRRGAPDAPTRSRPPP